MGMRKPFEMTGTELAALRPGDSVTDLHFLTTQARVLGHVSRGGERVGVRVRWGNGSGQVATADTLRSGR